MFEAYKVAVRLSLINNVSSGLVAMATQFQTLNRHIGSTQGSVTALERQLLNLKRMGLIGGAMTAVGGFGLSLFKGPLDAAREYETAYARFKTLNLGDVVNQQADSFARGTMAWGTSSKQLMDTLRESYGMIGNMEHAKAIAPMIGSLNSANSILFGGKVGAIDNNATKSIMRFIDMRGLTNSPEEIKHGLDLAQKLVTGSGGSLKFGDLESFAKRGGTAFKSMSDDGLLYMATVMQEMGGASAGTGLMSAYQNLVAGRTTKKSMAALQDLGLAKLGYVDHGDVGGKPYKTLQISEMQDGKLLRENFPQWVMKNVIPALERKGITESSAQAAAVNDILSNRTGSNLGVNFTTQFLQTIRDANMVKRAMGVDQTIQTAKDTPDGAMMNFHQNWVRLQTELGKVILPAVIRGVELLNGILTKTISLAREFPTLTKGIVVAFGALSAVVAVGGTLVLATAGFKALGLAIGGVSGALGAGGAGGAAGAAAGAGGLIGKMGALGSAFGILSIAAAPLLAMLAVKNWAEDTSHDQERVGTLKGWSDRAKGWMPSWMGDPTKKSRERYNAMRAELDGTGGDYVRPGGANGGQSGGDVYLDKEKVGKVLWSDVNKELRRPMAGTSRPDGRMAMTPVGASGR